MTIEKTEKLLKSLPAIMESTTEAVASVDNSGKIIGCNSQFRKLVGVKDGEEVLLKNIFKDCNLNSDKCNYADYQAVLLTKLDQSTVWVLLKIIHLGNEALGHHTLFIQEPESVRRIIDHLEYFESFDISTGFYNRRKGLSEFEQIQMGQTPGCTLLLKINTHLDEQKDYDLIFKSMAKHFEIFKGDYFFTRYSLDQVLFSYTTEDPNIEDKFESIIHTLRKINHNNKELDLLISFCDWNSEHPSINHTLDKLLSNQKSIHESDIVDNYKAHIAPENNYLKTLYQALENDEFVFYIQPQIDARTGQVASAELLARWIKEDGSIVPPSAFLRFIEEGEFSYEFYKWSIHKTIEVLKNIYQALGRWIPLSLNLAPTHINEKELILYLIDTVKQHKIPDDVLEIEVTERILASNEETILANLELLTENHIKIAIDDFGTGYSSLSYLRKFPLDRLKIDRIFVSNLSENEEDRLIVTSIISLAHVLNLEVIAEGVEQDGEASFLNEMGCEFFQGFLTGRPMPLDKFNNFVLSESAKENIPKDHIYLSSFSNENGPRTIKWKKSFSTDILSVDNDHRFLIDTLNDVTELYKNDPDSLNAVDVVNSIASETIKHFAYEEKVMRNIGYPRYQIHKEKHELLLSDIAKRKSDLEHVKNIDFEEIISYLKFWLLRHLVSEDTALRRYISKDN